MAQTYRYRLDPDDGRTYQAVLDAQGNPSQHVSTTSITTLGARGLTTQTRTETIYELAGEAFDEDGKIFVYTEIKKNTQKI